MLTTRPRLKPCSPLGRPHPQRRSSICSRGRAGTCSRTLLTTWAPRSSGRTSTSDPFMARPMGERPAATTTASGMDGGSPGGLTSVSSVARAWVRHTGGYSRGRPGGAIHCEEVEVHYFATGATGFIGRQLIPLLLARGGDVDVLVRPGSQARFD